MINPFSLVTGIAMAVIIGHTFEVKRHVGTLDRELRDIRRTTEEVETRTQTLAAEWARLNDQDRLRGLADRHLGQMVPMQPMQFVRLDEGVRRLPGALAWAGEVSPFAPRREPLALAEAATPPRDGTALAEASLAPRPPAGQVAAALARAGVATSTPQSSGLAAPSTPLAGMAQPTPRPAVPTVAASLTPAAPARPVQMAEAGVARPPVTASPRAVPLLPDAAPRLTAPANSLPSVAAPPAGLARSAASPGFVNPTLPASPGPVAAARVAPSPPASPSARPPALAAIAAPTRPVDSAALPPVRSTMLMQRVDTGSMLGGQSVVMAPPVPWGR